MDLAKRGDVEAFDALARLVGDRCVAIPSCLPSRRGWSVDHPVPGHSIPNSW